jgi:hypothetical protein
MVELPGPSYNNRRPPTSRYEGSTMAVHPDDRFSNERDLPAQPSEGIQPRIEAKPLPNLAGGDEEGAGLSSLAQSARAKQIKTARGILFFIGVITIVFNIIMMFVIRGQIDDEVRKLGFNPAAPPPEIQAQVRSLVVINYAICIGFALLGVVYLVLGFLTPRYPVMCTVTGLVLYIVGYLVSGMIDPRQLAAGIIIKVIIVVFLFKAVQAALAAEREKQAALRGDQGYA